MEARLVPPAPAVEKEEPQEALAPEKAEEGEAGGAAEEHHFCAYCATPCRRMPLSAEMRKAGPVPGLR